MNGGDGFLLKGSLCRTNRDTIEMQKNFRRKIVDDWFQNNFAMANYEFHNNMTVYESVEFYLKTWKD